MLCIILRNARLMLFQQHVVIVMEVMITLGSSTSSNQGTTVIIITQDTLLYPILVATVAVEDRVQCVCPRVKHAP